MSRIVQITLFIPKANHTFASTCELGLSETLEFHFIQLAFSISSPEWEVSHSGPVSEWRDEPHDPGAWLISDHYPVSAAHRENQAFVLGFNCIASCSSSRLLTWLWNAGNVCHRGLAEAVRHSERTPRSFSAANIFSMKSEWGRKEGRVRRKEVWVSSVVYGKDVINSPRDEAAPMASSSRQKATLWKTKQDSMTSEVSKQIIQWE